MGTARRLSTLRATYSGETDRRRFVFYERERERATERDRERDRERDIEREGVRFRRLWAKYDNGAACVMNEGP